MQCTKVHREKPHAPLYRTRYNLTLGTISVDIIGPLPESNSFNAILVIVDRFSRMIILMAIKDTLTTYQTAEIIEQSLE